MVDTLSNVVASSEIQRGFNIPSPPVAYDLDGIVRPANRE
jgi:hypothetical protein